MPRFFDNSQLSEQIRIASGQTINVSSIHKFGAVPSLSGGTTGTIWDVNDTKYPWSAFDNATTLQINTTTANDQVSTLDSGKSVTIIGLDSNFNEISETLTISGSTAGPSTNQYKRIYRAYTSADNLTRIKIKTTSTSTEVCRIGIGLAQTLMAIYTVPAGYTGYIDEGTCTIQAGGDATLNFYARYGGTGAFRIGHSAEISGTGGPYIKNFTIPLAFPEKSDLDVRATCRSNNSRITASFDIILIKNDV
jgi:hypothetical protein